MLGEMRVYVAIMCVTLQQPRLWRKRECGTVSPCREKITARQNYL